MKCEVCQKSESEKNSVVCSHRCAVLRLKVFELTDKYFPVNGCDNCRGDLHQGCTEECRDEFRKAHKFAKDLWALARFALHPTEAA